MKKETVKLHFHLNGVKHIKTDLTLIEADLFKKMFLTQQDNGPVYITP